MAAEGVAGNVIEDLFTEVQGLPLSDINNQLGYADLMLTNLGVTQLVIAVKRRSSLAWDRMKSELNWNNRA